MFQFWHGDVSIDYAWPPILVHTTSVGSIQFLRRNLLFHPIKECSMVVLLVHLVLQSCSLLISTMGMVIFSCPFNLLFSETIIKGPLCIGTPVYKELFQDHSLILYNLPKSNLIKNFSHCCRNGLKLLDLRWKVLFFHYKYP